MPSFQGIQKDCNEIVAQLSAKLREQFRDKDVSSYMLNILYKARLVNEILALKNFAYFKASLWAFNTALLVCAEMPIVQ